MKILQKYLSAFSLVVLSVFAVGCSDIASTEPALDPSPMTVTSTTGQRFVVAWEPNPSAAQVSATVGPLGGVMLLGRNSLWIPIGAVSSPTQFKMVRDLENPLRVKLTATKNTENDVGSAGFNAPVKLGIYYGNVGQLPTTLETMQMMYFRPDGLVEPLESQVRIYENLVVAELPHFSVFGLGWP